MASDEPVFIDDDQNADWIKTPENRASEARIHDELAEELQKQSSESVGNETPE